MAYIPHTKADRRAMLAAIGLERMDDLYDVIPKEVRFPDLDLPDPISEMEITREMLTLSEANLEVQHVPCFLGAGAYNHFIPSVIDHILRRNEFYTAYTPYQTLIFENGL